MAFELTEFEIVLKELGVIETQEEFSELFGKGSSYVSCLLAKDNSPSLEAFMHLSKNIQKIVDMYEEIICGPNSTWDDFHSAHKIRILHGCVLQEIRKILSGNDAVMDKFFDRKRRSIYD